MLRELSQIQEEKSHVISHVNEIFRSQIQGAKQFIRGKKAGENLNMFIKQQISNYV